MRTGALSLPLLSVGLEELLAQGDPTQAEPLVWLKGHHSGIHSAPLFSASGYPAFMSRFFRSLGNEPTSEALAGHPILILEGSFSDDALLKVHQTLNSWVSGARVVILLGNEAAYGNDRPEGYLDLEAEILGDNPLPIIRIPGLPAQPRHLLGVLNHLLLYGLPDMDEFRRPTLFFENLICDRCAYRGAFESGDFVKHFGQKEGCLYLLGCKGPVTRNDCATHHWNGSNTWCVGVGSPCTGCSEPLFPTHHGLGMYGQLSHRAAGVRTGWIRHSESLAYTALGVTAVGLAIHGFTKHSLGQYQVDDSEES
ncbi:MAG: hypothetical protein A2527_06080 [Candidatus Lambdaproteobacteria bacterium RIFOXYD2_FULL_50_16]|uniref:Cytochrome-c3 hydrogenase C-terminal domain-containing protein n=1 Tax=Candidatus Lambdaproteobacteria bacterium RIFOXYD2_FULL_50_16 TaxID=1817772 RepID=A0A1F6G9G6_9PROT|nr:MAG: hypothetical protein A2527_06080 [Candidatus Lambdaproteobacteria bacterium RIFOXYD2_FULL_50_16]